MREYSLSDRLKEYMAKYGLRQADILARTRQLEPEYGVKISKSMLSQYISGYTNPNQIRTDMLAKALGVDPAWLMGYELKDPLPQNLFDISDLHKQKIPLLGEIAAGEPICNEYVDTYIEGPAKADCALKVVGDSMMPSYLDGDIVYIRSQPDVEFEGQVAAVVLDDEALLKHVHHFPNGILLRSENPAYTDRIVTGTDYGSVRLIGVACGFTRMFK